MPVLNDAYNLRFGGQQVRAAKLRGTDVWILPVPVNTVAPTISGGTTVGSTLTCSTGTWTNSPTSYAYQWQEWTGTWTDVSGATSNTYVPDHSGQFRCRVTPTNAFGDGAPATSNQVTISAGGTGFFGKNTAGTAGIPASDNRYIASRFYLDRTATITDINIYLNGTGDAVRGCIWNDASGEPGTIAVIGGFQSASAVGWAESVVPDGGVTLSAGWYWIGVVSGGYYNSFSHELTGGEAMRLNNGGNFLSPGNWPATAGNSYESLLSAYANYTY